MRWGDIVRVDLSPVRGSEADRIRPAVVVSTDALNRAVQARGRGVITVVPVTSNVTKVYPFQVAISSAHRSQTGLDVDGKAQAEQVRAVDVSRVVSTTGALPAEQHEELADALRLHLGLDRDRRR